MSHIPHLTALEAQKELTEAVKTTQGSQKKASWQASARPCWWINSHTVTLSDGAEVSTGTFDMAGRRKWKKSHFQAALFLYEQWKTGTLESSESKEEAKLEDEIIEEPKPVTRKTKRRTKEERMLKQASSTPPILKGKRRKAILATQMVDAGTSASSDESAEEKEAANQPQPRSRAFRNAKHSNNTATPEHTSPSISRQSPSQPESPSSSSEPDASPSPIMRRTRARCHVKKLKSSPKLCQTPIQKRSLRPRKARNGKAVSRTAQKTKFTEEPIGRSRKGNRGDSNIRSPAQMGGSVSNSESEADLPRTHGQESESTFSPGLQRHRRTSPRLSKTISRSKQELDSTSTRKRKLAEPEVKGVITNRRMALREHNGRSQTQKKRLRKKRRVSASEDLPSDKENIAPGTKTIAKSTRLAASTEKISESAEAEVDPIGEIETNNEDLETETENADEVAKRQKKELLVRFFHDQIAKAKATRDRELHLIEQNFAEFEADCHFQKVRVKNDLRTNYSAGRFKFAKRILEMPMSTFANEHGGNTDEWLIHDTERGVNKTFEALHNGEDPKMFGMLPPKTSAAQSRLAALTKTARKTQRRAVDEAAEAGLTVRRSKRGAAKIATERTRAIVSYTPRTAQKKARVQNPGVPGPSGTAISRAKLGPSYGRAGFTRQGLGDLIQSIRKGAGAALEDRAEFLADFTSLIQEGVLEERSDGE